MNMLQFAPRLRSNIGRLFWSVLVLGAFLKATPAEASVDLVFYTSPSYSVSSTGSWGQNVNVSVSVANLGTTASSAFTVNLYLSSSSTFNVATATLWQTLNFNSGLPANNFGGETNAATLLPLTIPSGLGSTTGGTSSKVYITAVISQNSAQTQTSSTITTPYPDLIGYNGQGYGFNLQQSTATWNQVVGLEYAIANQAAGTAGPFKANVYLCATSNFGSGNVPNTSTTYYLGSISSTGLAGGFITFSASTAGQYGYNNFQLPASNPFGGSNTSFYVGMVINPTSTTASPNTPITESNYTNDCNQGSGIDWAPITITGPQPVIAAVGSNPAGSTSALQFGNVNLGETATQTVTITDSGQANLQINSITATAPFTVTSIVSSLEDSSPTIPGIMASNNSENWVVTLTYTPTAASTQTGTLTITSNGSNSTSNTFALSGTGVAVPHLAFTNPVPSNNDNLIANYGGIADNSSLTETFTLQNTGTAPLTISQNGIALTTTQSGVWTLISITSNTQGAINLSSASKNITASGAETWSVVVKFAPTTNQGYASGLQIFSNDPSTPTTTGAPTMTCALQGQGLTPMTINVASAVNGVTDSNPLVMNFGSVHATGLQNVTGTVTLTNTGQVALIIAQGGISLGSNTNFQITGISSSTQGAITLSGGTATIAANSAETWTISLVFAPPAASNPNTTNNDNTTLTISSNDPANGTENIALNGTGLNRPGILVTTPQGGTNLPFGPVLNDGAGNHVGTQTFTIQNVGLQPLVVSQNGITLVNATGFSIRSVVSSTQGTINLASGSASIAAKQTETWTVTVGLHPTSNTAYSGTLDIASNDPVTPTYALALTGTGTTPTLTLQPTTSSTPTLYIEAGQVYNITWTAADTSDTASSATLTFSTSVSNTLPASGLTTIATIPYSSTTTSYAWRPSASLVGQSVYIYGNLQDQDISVGSYSAQKVYVEAAGSFNLTSALTTTSSTYAYTYLYNGKAYGGTATLQPGNNIITISAPLSGGGTAVHQITVNEVSSLLTAQGYTYDELNRVKTYTNGNGITTTYTYSLAGNLTQTSATNGNVVNYTYDSLNRKTSMVDSTGTTFYGYDDLDRMTSITYSVSGNLTDPNNLAIGYQYDNANHETQITYPGGEVVNYTYDNAGRLLTVADVLNGTTTYNYTYHYNPTTGQLQTFNRADGVVTSYGYDGAARLNDIKHVNSSNQTLAEYNYNALDANGNAVNLLTTLNNGSQQQTLYSYDSLQHLVQVTYGGTATAVPNTDETVAYTYDNNGNRLTQKTTINGAVTQSLTYSYGSANQLIQIVNQAGTLQASYVYDPAGNRIEKITPAGNTYYAYNELNLLTTVVTPTDYILYTYNGAGQRVSQNVDGVLTSYVVDPTQSTYQVIQERNGADISTSAITVGHVYGADRLGNNPASGTSQFYLPDRIGSAMLITDPNGNIITSNSYDAFGATPRP
jgi:YD repeat-containing protein